MKFVILIRLLLNFFDYFQQIKILKYLKNNLKSKIILFDVGAHHGETLKLFSKKFEIEEIHCFEASQLILNFYLKKVKI